MKASNKPYDCELVAQGWRIRFIRSFYGMTATDFAKKLNVGKAAVSNWENGYGRIGLSQVRFLLSEWHISADFVIGGYVNGLDDNMRNAWRKFQKENELD